LRRTPTAGAGAHRAARHGVAGHGGLAARTRHAVSLRQAGRKHLLAAQRSIAGKHAALQSPAARKAAAKAHRATAAVRAKLATNAAAKHWVMPEWVPFALAAVFILLAFSVHGFSTLIRRGPTPPPTTPL
jgi:hypothetical protein